MKQETLTNGKLTHVRHTLMFPDKEGHGIIEARKVFLGTGVGGWRFFIELSRFHKLSREVFPNFLVALKAGKEVAREQMDDVMFALRVPAKTAFRMIDLFLEEEFEE